MMSKLLDYLYPRHCALCASRCQTSATPPVALCPGCLADLPWLGTSCRQCAQPLVAQQQDALCGQCQQKSPRFDSTRAVFHYAEPVEWLIQQMKYHRKPAITRLLAELMAQHIVQSAGPLPDVIIPVPLHFQRQHQRGYNQSEELARLIAKKIGRPMVCDYIERFRPSQKQTGLNARQRRRNVKNIFRLKKHLVNKPHKKTYRHIALVDDVMSTGSTVNEISRLLKRHGAVRVDVWLLARASRD